MLQDAHLVPAKPEIFRDFPCPSCGAKEISAHGVHFPGIHVLGEYSCRSCRLSFLRDLPVGFAVDHPMAIGLPDGRLFNLQGGRGWIHKPLMAGWRTPSKAAVHIERIVHREARRVIILNTLDFLYGHVVLKLFNAQHYLDAHPELGLVVIVPKSCAWLVPAGACETWVVDQKLGRAPGWHEAIDAFVREQWPRFTEVYLGRGYAHPEFRSIDIERFTGEAPFALDDLLQRPPHITFVARRDRLWFASGVDKFLYRAFHKIGLKAVAGLWIRRQDRLIARTMRRIERSVPGVRFSVVGLGQAGGFPSRVEDLRTTRMDTDTERTWCKAYAKSQFVIGVHGSNMILPTAHAAGCLEILPYDRYGNIVQDISVRWHDRMQLFLYRFLDEFASPKEVARHAASMFRDFEVYHRDNRINIFGS